MKRLFYSLLLLALVATFLPSVAIAAQPSSYDIIQLEGLIDSRLEVSELSDSLLPQDDETQRYEVTLITGDVVVVSISPNGEKGIAIMPSDTIQGQHFQVFERPVITQTGTEMNTYVIPDGVDLTKMDIELFNIDYLIEENYYDLPYLPVIVTTKVTAGAQGVRALQQEMSNLAQSIDTHPQFTVVSTHLSLDNIDSSYQLFTEMDTVEKVWLDTKVSITLDDSVPLIGAPDVWDSGYDGSGITIAILDTGIDDSHSDLDDLDDVPATTDPKVLLEINFTDDPSADDGHGHGTHCAGIAAGTGSTYRGVAPGAWLYNIKVMNQYGTGMTSWVIDGVEYAALGPDGLADTGDEADVISMSFGIGITDGTDPVSVAVDWAVNQGVVAVKSAGNNGEYFTISCPGAVEKVITVGASTKADTLASFSSMGPTLDYRVKPDVMAPGVDIVAARASGTSMGTPLDDYYTSANGTSMAAPHVAGAAALILQANPTIPLGWSAPAFVKNSLMANSIDLSYDVYTQGAGRIYLPPSTSPLILVDPATTSFGNYTSDTTDSQLLTFYNLDAIDHELALSVSLSEVFSDVSYPGNASLTTYALTVPAGGSATTTLEIDTLGLPGGLYSGWIEAIIDGGNGIHTIFGLSKLLSELVVEKIDQNGNPGVGHYIRVFTDEADPYYQEGYTDESGSVTLYVPDGDYQVVSLATNATENASVWNFTEATVSGNTLVSMDDRNTVAIDFDPNKPDQIMAEKVSKMHYSGQNIYYMFYDIWGYPTTNITYVSPNSLWGSTYNYSFHPDAFTIDNTPEWSKLVYTLDEVTGPVTFVADYNDTVTRETSCLTMYEDEQAQYFLFTISALSGGDVTFVWGMDAPMVRTEILSPDPVRYSSVHRKSYPQGEWNFSSPWLSYLPGEMLTYAIGEHPFNSGAEIVLYPDLLWVWRDISTDVLGNEFENHTRSPGGHITVEQDAVVVLDKDINDFIYESIGFAGTPATTVTIDGWSGLPLSTDTHTMLSFVADPAIDHTPPELAWMRVVSVSSPDDPPGLYNQMAPTDYVGVEMGIVDTESGVADISLLYSTDDGVTWNPTTVIPQGGDQYLANLGDIEDAFISLDVNLLDNQGNIRQHRVMHGYRVLSRLIYPEDGSERGAGDVYFTWYEHADATGYHIQIDEVSTFDSPALVEADTIDAQYATSLGPGTYYWRVKVYTPPGETAYTLPWQFTTTNTVLPVTTDTDYEYYPVITQTDNGDIWVAWNSYRSSNYDIWYKTSPDDGATWSADTRLTTDGGSDWYPAITQNDDGNIWVAWYSYRSGNPDIWYKTSPDDGATWSAATQLTTDTGSDYYPTITQTDDGNIWVAWESYRSGNADIWYKTSSDYGATWSVDTQLTTDTGSDYYPAITQTDNGNIWVAWESYRSGNADIWYKTSSDYGATWSVATQLTTDTDYDEYPTITQTDDGNIWIAWGSYRSGNRDIWYKTSHDYGATWSVPEQFTQFTGYDYYPGIASLADGNVAIAWCSDRTVNYDIWFGIPGVLEDANPPPHVDWYQHDPSPNPDSDEIVIITAGLSDETEVIDGKFVWSVDSVPQGDLQMYDDGTHGDTFAGDGTWTVQIGPFPMGTQVSYQVLVTDTDTNTVLAPSYPVQFQSLEPWVATSNILLIVDSRSSVEVQTYSPYYQDALNSLCINYDFWDASLRGVPDNTERAAYLDGAIIYMIPTYISYLLQPDTTQQASSALASYLDSGGHLFIGGGYSALYLGFFNNSFLTNYLHADYIGYPDLYGILGFDSDPIGDGLSFGISQSGREIDPISPAVNIFTYDTSATEPTLLDEQDWGSDIFTPFDEGVPVHPDQVETLEVGAEGIVSSGTAGLRVDTGTYKLVYLDFGFESILDASNRVTVMDRVMDWLLPLEDVIVTINAPSQVPDDYDFTVTVDITDVTDLNAAQYDITFDTTVLRLDDVTDGQIDSTDFEVFGFSEVTTGTYRILNSLGLDSVSGSGYMSVLHFHSVGSLGDSSNIEISNGLLSGIVAEIPASWFGDSVEINIQPGDANGNGNIDVLDITKVARIILGWDPETPGADCNQDGVVNALDMTCIAKIILGRPQYGGTYTIASAANWTYFDEVAGGNYGGHVYAPATHLTQNELLQGDWTKGPAGTNETDWINGGDNRMDQKTGCLAESWEIPELGTIIFHIRDDVYWQDKAPMNGRRLLPEDIEWSLERAMTGGYFFYAYPNMCATIDISSDNENWTVTCTVPADQWTAMVTMIPDYTSIAPREAVELWGDQTDWEHALGTGPFVLTYFVSNSHVTFVRNPDYWETNPIGLGEGDQLPYIDEYRILIIPDSSTRYAAFRVGAIDSLSGLYPNDAIPLINDPDLSAIEYKEYMPDVSYCMFFRTDIPESPFSIKEVRQAMMLAIDQPAIRDQYWQGHAELVGWPITAHPAYDDAMPDLGEFPGNVQALYGRDVAAAQALLATTPYPNGFDCSVLCWDTPIMIDVLSMYLPMLADININMTIDVLDYSVYLSRSRARNHGAFEIMYATPSGNGTYMKMINFRGPNSYNVSHIDEDYSVPEIEAAYAAIQPYVGINEATMMAINKDLMPWLLEQAFVINTPTNYMYNLWWPWVKNYYGCAYVGYYNSYGVAKYVWIDQDLKAAMGY